jgi:hypothetical protein
MFAAIVEPMMNDKPAAKLIDKPGKYDGIQKERYHGQLTVRPSFSRSMAHTLVTSCPAKLWDSCYLNPHVQPEQKDKFDIGDASHLIVLEPEQWGDRVVLIDADSYRTNAAKESRDAAYAAGKTPLLPDQRAHILAMHRALIADSDARALLFDDTGGENEQTFVAIDQDTGLYLKARTDRVNLRDGRVVDFKSTGSANPDDWAGRVYDNGYYIQDPFYREVIGGATGEWIKEFIFVVQEAKPPYLISINWLDTIDIELGRNSMGRATDIFARCLATGRWPGYGRNMVKMKAWARNALADIDERERLRPKPKITREQIQRAIAAQAPLEQPA